MAELMEHVRVLAEQIGPRPISTEEEHQAAVYIAQELSDEGLEVDVDEFATPTGTRWPYALAFICIVIGTLVSGVGCFIESIRLSMFVVGILLIVFGLVVAYLEYSGVCPLSSRRMGGVSQNVVARYVPSSVAREQRRRKIVIVSHIDTVRMQPEAAPVLAAHASLLRSIAYFDIPVILVLTIVRVLPLPVPAQTDLVLWIVSLVGCVYLLAAALCILAGSLTAYLAGGNDNASSNAVMLATAGRLLDPRERGRYAVNQPAAHGKDAPAEAFEAQGRGAAREAAAVEPHAHEPVLHDEQTARERGVVSADVPLEYATQQHDEPPGQRDEEHVSSDGHAVEVEPASEQAQVEESDGSGGQEAERAPSAWAQRLQEAAQANVATPAQPSSDSVARDAVPAWYSTAKRKAAHEAQGQDDAPASTSQDAEHPVAYRSRFADVPLRGGVQRPSAAELDERPGEPDEGPGEPEAREEPESHEEPPEQLVTRDGQQASGQANVVAFAPPQAQGEQPQAEAVGSPDAQAQSAPSAPPAASEPLEPPEPPERPVATESSSPSAEGRADEPSSAVDVSALLDESLADGEQDGHDEPEGLEFDISDEELDDISPEDVSGAFPAVQHGSVTGGSTAFEPPVRTRGSLLQGFTSRIPIVGAQGHASASDDAERPAKPQRRKPTARRLSDDFKPTEKSGTAYESGMFEALRQEAPISSTYEATEQADPFAPRDEYGNVSDDAKTQPRRAPARRSNPSLSSSFEPVTAASTSSFPSLTSSFPTLNAQDVATLEAGEVSAGGHVADVSDAVESPLADDFAFDASMTTEIQMPESRFHNAVDKVGGLFGRGKKAKRAQDDAFSSQDEEQWDDEDDFGWKGGGYLDTSESAYEAAKTRASEIRESVVSMTESDLLDKEVWFVALGASSANERGMHNFLELHGQDLRGALIINLECVGAGELRYLEVEGMGKERRSDRRLQNLVRSASASLDGTSMRSQKMTWRNTDATPAMRQGLRAMSIMGFAGSAPVNWHWKGDTAAIVEEENLEYATKLLLKIIEDA